MAKGIFTGDYTLIPIYTPGPRGSTRRDAGQWVYVPDPLNPLTFTRPDGTTITLRDRFVTDMASTPRCIWSIPGLAPHEMERPALIHDWLYVTHHAGNDILGFKASNQVLYEACRAEGYSRTLSYLVREGCDWFGSSIWKGKKSS